MIYIPTMTGKTHTVINPMENVLYSPSKRTEVIIYGENITIWDNHTFYWYKRYTKPDKVEKAFEHYNWFIQFVLDNHIEGVTVITPDVDWLPSFYRNIIQNKWRYACYKFPQLYVPNTWKSTNGLNIVGHALRIGQTDYHPEWTHCLGFKKEFPCKLLTYDSINEILQ